MVNAEIKGDKYLIKFKGKKQQFNEYINKIMTLSHKEWNVQERCWTIPLFDRPELEDLFDNIEFLEEVQDLKKKDPELAKAYADMGKSMKLQPYDYQKEAIKFGLDTNNILIVYPCGSGKLCV